MLKYLSNLTLIAVLFFGFSLFFGKSFAIPSHACSCLNRSEPSEFAETSDSVFRGKIKNIENTPDTDSPGNNKAEFEVYQVWKGDVEGQIFVQTALDSAACGFNFEVGSEYVVYANVNESGNLSTGLCSGTVMATDDYLTTVETQLGEGELIYYALENGGSTNPDGVKTDNSNANSKDESSLQKDEVIIALFILVGINLLLTLFSLSLSLKGGKKVQ